MDSLSDFQLAKGRAAMLIPVVLFFLLLVALSFGIATTIIGAKQAKRKLMVAKRAYQLSLENVKKSPTSPDARQAALELGRRYSAFTREHRNVTLFDEIALKNDIDAACAGAVAFHSMKLAYLSHLSWKRRGDEERIFCTATQTFS